MFILHKCNEKFSSRTGKKNIIKFTLIIHVIACHEVSLLKCQCKESKSESIVINSLELQKLHLLQM